MRDVVGTHGRRGRRAADHFRDKRKKNQQRAAGTGRTPEALLEDAHVVDLHRRGESALVDAAVAAPVAAPSEVEDDVEGSIVGPVIAAEATVLVLQLELAIDVGGDGAKIACFVRISKFSLLFLLFRFLFCCN